MKLDVAKLMRKREPATGRRMTRIDAHDRDAVSNACHPGQVPDQRRILNAHAEVARQRLDRDGRAGEPVKLAESLGLLARKSDLRRHQDFPGDRARARVISVSSWACWAALMGLPPNLLAFSGHSSA